MSKLSWKAVRKKAVYCSPACGADCKFQDFRGARAKAKKLAALLGPGFKPHVWENMGWRWSVVDKEGYGIAVYARRDGSYVATYDNRVWRSGSTAKKALKELREALQENLYQYELRLENLIKVMEKR